MTVATFSYLNRRYRTAEPQFTPFSTKYTSPPLNLGDMARISLSPFERLPNEILSSVLLEVKATSDPSSFLRCLSCCKRWHEVGIPILYRDVLLTDSNVSAFVQCYNSQYGPLLRSLTITINPVQPAQTDEDEQRLPRYGSQGAKVLWHTLQQISYKFASMDRMTTFSLTFSSNYSYVRGFWIPRATIATMIRALPEACVNVEINTRDYEGPAPVFVHLCDEIRAILPRLQNLRLCLAIMCPAIFMTDCGSLDSGEHHSSYQPVVAPFLKTFVVNCLPGSIRSDQAGLCIPEWWSAGMPPYWSDYAAPVHIKDFEEIVIAIVNALWFSKENASFPVAEHISVLHAGSHGTTASLNRRNILEGTMWAVPFGPIGTRETDRFFIRTPEDQELVSDQWTIRALAEGETWVETMSGCRIPASTVAKQPSVYAKKGLPFVDAETWRSSNPKISCALWQNEKLQQTRLIKAEYREGLSDMRAVGEKISGS